MSDIHALSGAYAVDALDQFERTAFERHLAHCPHCLHEVDGLREASASLAEITATTPPPSLRDRVLAEVATVRPLPPVVTALPSPALPLRRHRSQPSRWTAGLVAAAAVVAALGVGAAVTQPWQQETVESAESGTGSQLADAVLAAPDAEEVHHTFADGATAVVVRSRQLDRAVVVTKGMSDAPSGHAYELWFKASNGALKPAGLMPAGPDNTVVLEGDASDATAVGITVEPTDHIDDIPSSDPVVLDFENT